MSIFRYANPSGNWFKGNTHLHTPASDGGTSVEEMERMYSGAGYDFLFRADHWVLSDVGGEQRESPLLWLDGVELDGRDHTGAYYHVVCLGKFEGLSREMGFVAALEAVRAQGGMLILAHPNWTGNSLDDAFRHGFHGVEVYNHVCQWLNGKGDGLLFWDAMLQRAPATLGFAVDDAHLRPQHPGWNGGWIMVDASDCTAPALMSAIRDGRYYSSCGPEFHKIEVHDRTVSIHTSSVQFVRLVGPGSRGARIGSFGDERITEGELEIPEGFPYVRVEVEDERGKRAWTNPLFVDDAEA